MSGDRTVRIVGDVGASGGGSYHDLECYVPFQSRNRDREQKVRLSELSSVWEPCRHCKPGRIAEKSVGSSRHTGVRAGDDVHVVDLETGKADVHRISRYRTDRGPGEISPSTPLGQALIGADVDQEVSVKLPKGRSKRLRVVSFETVEDE